MSKPVLFIDFDGTICFDCFWNSADEALRQKVSQYLFVLNAPLVDEWMRGQYIAEDIVKRTANDNDVEYDLLWRMFVADCTAMRVDPVVLDFVQAARGSYTTVLVTDNMDSFNRYTSPTLGLATVFNIIANSYDYGVLKNDSNGALFRAVCEKYDLSLRGAHLFDNGQDNCEVFAALGGSSHLINNNRGIINALTDVGVKIYK